MTREELWHENRKLREQNENLMDVIKKTHQAWFVDRACETSVELMLLEAIALEGETDE